MKVTNFIWWFIKIILFIITIILIANNLQSAEINLLGMYKIYLPIIVIVFCSILLGMIVGIIIKLPQIISLKNQVKKLEKELKKATNNIEYNNYNSAQFISPAKDEIN